MRTPTSFKTAFYFIRPYSWRVMVISALILAYAVLEGAGIGVLYHLLNSTVGDAAQPGAVIAFIPSVIGHVSARLPIKDPVILTCGMLILIVILKDIIGYLSQILGYFVGYRVWEDNQKKIYEKYIRSDYLHFLEKKQGEIIYQISLAPNALGTVFNVLPQIAVEIVKMTVIIGMLFLMAPKLSIAIIVFTFFYFGVTRYTARKVSYYIGHGRVDAGNRQNIFMAEMSNGFRQIKLFQAEDRWIKGFVKAVRDYFMLSRRDCMCLSLPKHLLDFVFTAGLATVMIVVQVTNPGGLKGMLPVLGVLIYGLMRIAPSLNVLSNNMMQLMSSLPNLETLKSVMEQNVNEIKDGHYELTAFQSGIRFDRLSFSYPTRKNVLRDVVMDFPKGKHSAIIGPSGTGKTTIFDLVIRLFDPQEGAILVDGMDLRKIKLSTWLERIAYVSQDTFIFNASVYENIIFGKKNVSVQDVERAARNANAYDFIMDLPEKFDTVVGDKGLKLSGGQRQRLAIARALLRNPEILILDEATSALDSESEALVQDAIRRVSRARTVISIAHRLSTVKDVDLIYVLEGGRVVESGHHDELMKMNGRYKYYHDMQMNRKNIEERNMTT